TTRVMPRPTAALLMTPPPSSSPAAACERRSCSLPQSRRDTLVSKGSSSTLELSSHQSSRGIASGSETYSSRCSRQPDQSWVHPPARDGWSRIWEADSVRTQVAALRRALMPPRRPPSPDDPPRDSV